VKRVIDFGIDFGAPAERIMHFPDKTMDRDVDTRRRLEGINPPFPCASPCFINYSFDEDPSLHAQWASKNRSTHAHHMVIVV